MKVCDGVRPLPLVFRASSPCDIFAAAEQCAATHLEPLPPPIAQRWRWRLYGAQVKGHSRGP